ncbi:DUF7562 family protein [Natronomonas sp. EA1]|uniref:DUF7562 family protein n=1 Tax=Natronomonas sp. EA1 TaxID=3421655 RepID=UPI003EBCFDF7
MWGTRGGRDEVTCIACGEAVPRTDAREYDKEGDRWERHGKEFEYLCKPCFRDTCNQPRGDLEAVLTESGAGEVANAEFLDRYTSLVRDRTRPERNEHE